MKPATETEPIPLALYGDSTTIRRIFYWLLTIILASLIVVAAISFFSHDVVSAIWIFLGVALIVFSFPLVQSNKFDLAVVCVALALLLVVTVTATFGLGIHHISVTGYALILIIVSLTVRKRTLVILTAITLGCVAWLVFGELYGAYNLKPFERSVAGDFFTAAIVILSTIIIARTLTILFLKSHEQINEELARRKATEEALRRWFHIFEYAEWGVVVGSADGKLIEQMNPAFARMHGWTMDELTGKPLLALFAPEVWEEVPVNIQLAHENGHHTWESIHIRKDGTRFPVMIDVTTIRDEQGQLLYRVGNVQDITERKRVENALSASHKNLEDILNSIDSLVYVVDMATYEIIFINQYGVERWGDVQGRTCWQMLQKDAHDPCEFCTNNRLIGPDGKPAGIYVWEFQNTVNHQWYECHDRAIYWHDGRLVRIEIANDITGRKQTEGLINMRLELMEFAADHSLLEVLQKSLDQVGELTNSPIGFYHFVNEDQKNLSLQTWSTRTLQEFCTAKGAGAHYSIDQAGVWVDCLREKRPVIHNDYASLPASRRRGLPEGHAPIIRELVVPIFRGNLVVAILGAGNKPNDYTTADVEIVQYFADVAWEVAERKRAEEALRESEKKYRAIIALSPIPYALNDDHQNIILLNPSFVETFGYTPDEIPTLADWWPKAYPDPQYRQWVADTWQARLEQAKREARPFEPLEVRIRCRNGEDRTALASATPLGSSFAGLHLVSLFDITERKRAEEELRYLSMHDILTGVFNRVFFEAELRRLESSREFPISIIVADLDNMKMINDTFGHIAGDELLKRAVSVLQSTFRAADILARTGGDEFAALLPRTDELAAEQALRRIRAKMDEYNESHSNLPVHLSLGACTAKGENIMAAFVEADQRMYADKALRKRNN